MKKIYNLYKTKDLYFNFSKYSIIQLIFVNSDNIDLMIYKTYDFSFCKNKNRIRSKIINRNKKYTSRGFTIKYINVEPHIDAINEMFKCRKCCNNIYLFDIKDYKPDDIIVCKDDCIRNKIGVKHKIDPYFGGGRNFKERINFSGVFVH